MKKILIIHTGGTVSMSQNQFNQVVTNDISPISLHKNIINQYANVYEISPFNVPSSHIILSHVIKLKGIIMKEFSKSHYDGCVITHGTDTLEETAYLLDLMIDISQPIVITGAIRSSNEIGSSGLYNFISTIRVATSLEASDKDVIVVFNDEVHTARDVTKTHISDINTSQSPNQSPLGILTKDCVQFYNRPYRQRIFPRIDESLNVSLIKAYMGITKDVLEFYARQNVQGITIEALGQGNLPPSCPKGTESCVKKDIPIILVSRSFNGIVSPMYNYESGGFRLAEEGPISSSGLNGPKAKLKLLIGLSNHMDHKELKEYFKT